MLYRVVLLTISPRVLKSYCICYHVCKLRKSSSATGAARAHAEGFCAGKPLLERFWCSVFKGRRRIPHTPRLNASFCSRQNYGRPSRFSVNAFKIPEVMGRILREHNPWWWRGGWELLDAQANGKKNMLICWLVLHFYVFRTEPSGRETCWCRIGYRYC